MIGKKNSIPFSRNLIMYSGFAKKRGHLDEIVFNHFILFRIPFLLFWSNIDFTFKGEYVKNFEIF
jgi:hypothetical protein